MMLMVCDGKNSKPVVSMLVARDGKKNSAPVVLCNGKSTTPVALLLMVCDGKKKKSTPVVLMLAVCDASLSLLQTL